MPDTDPRQKITELVEHARLAMLTTTTEEGKLVSRPMALQEAGFDGDLWFFAYEDSDEVHELQARPQVNVSFSNSKQSEWTSVSGRAEVVHDRTKMEELYSAPLKVWFPDGLDTPRITLIKVHAETAEYWDSPSSAAKKLIGAVRAAVTNDPDKFPGENRTVEL